jgi:hypothetical protein
METGRSVFWLLEEWTIIWEQDELEYRVVNVGDHGLHCSLYFVKFPVLLRPACRQAGAAHIVKRSSALEGRTRCDYLRSPINKFSHLLVIEFICG